jgi:hypothetical protein
MLKRKINLFEPIINDLNPRIYVDTIRNLSHELAETYQEIADLKAKEDEESHVQKINELRVISTNSSFICLLVCTYAYGYI